MVVRVGKKIAVTLATGLLASIMAGGLSAFVLPTGQAHAASSQKSGWHTVSKGAKAYYKHGERVTGVQKIKGHYYYFTNKGILKTANTKAGKTTYYIGLKNRLDGIKYKGAYYYASGVEMTKADRMDFKTYQHARSIVKKITKPSWPKSKKLLTCFRWVMRKPYIMYRSFDYYQPGWTSIYAEDHFTRKGGECIADGAAFAYLAAAIGYKSTYAAVDGKQYSNPHGWTMIGRKVYDPLFAESQGFSRYYGVTHGTYEVNPGAKKKVPYFSAKHAKKAKSAKRDLTKVGLVKVKDSLYFYADGLPVKSTWKTVGKARYYFGAKGRAKVKPSRIGSKRYVFAKSGKLVRATTGSTQVKSIDGTLYRVNRKGRAVAGLKSDGRWCFATGRVLTGVAVTSSGKFVAASGSGVYDAALTKKLRAAAKKGQPAATLRDLLGKPKKEAYADNCERIDEAGWQDGLWAYGSFTVTTLRAPDGTETVRNVQKR